MYQKNIFLVLIFMAGLSNVTSSYAQNESKIDSLTQILLVAKDTSRFNTLWELTFELVSKDPDKSISYASEAQEIGFTRGDSLEIVKAGRILGQLYRRVGKVEEAIQKLLYVLPISKRNNFDRETKFILNATAIAYSFSAQYDKSLEYHFQSLVIREKEGDKKELSIALNNIGFVYFKLKNFELALDYYLLSLKAKEEAKDSFDLDRLLINIGLCYNSLADHVEARKYFDKGFKTCGNECDVQVIIEGEFGIGLSYLMDGNEELALNHFQKSLTLSKQEANQFFQLENLLQLAKIYIAQNDLKKANAYLMESKPIAEEGDYKDLLVDLYQITANYYTSSGDFKKANSYQQKYSELKDSIFDADVIKNLTLVQTKYAQRENLGIIAANAQTLALKEQVIAQQALFNWLLGTIIALSGILGVIIYRNLRSIRSVNDKLDIANTTIEKQNKQLDQQVHILDREVRVKTKELADTNENLIKVNDELDNFIYKTSHDIRGPLASLKGMVNLAMMDVKDDKALGYLSRLDVTAEKLNIVLTRLLIVNRINHAELKPEAVHFEPIIQEILTHEMKKGVPKKVTIRYDVAPHVHLNSDREMVQLVLENLIDNAIKFHDESDRVESFVNIWVTSEDGIVEARVKDNGVGISDVNREKIFQMFVRASERSETGGIGLYLAKTATEKLGGTIDLISTTNETEFVVRLPQNPGNVVGRI